VPNVVELPQGETAKQQKVKEAFFFFFVEGMCKECHCASAHSMDL
jgi:hypothetical protein